MVPLKKTTGRASLKRQHPEDPTDDSEEELQFSDEEGGYRIDDIYIPPPPKPALTTEDVGPRLIITKMVNEWFKSYAETRIVGPFHKRFNTVIGPNGSGKSNVIDSMLFVFGYRASRIRSKKLSSLIHNSESFQNVPSCTVSVHFAQITDKEGDDYEIVPGTEIVVSRTANRDNSSYYQLDGRRVQFKEVAALLRKHGIDLDHNRFLILQGEVEQIAMMKCKAENPHETGMLEYLEDVIGTIRYKEPLAKLMERHQVLTDRRNEKLNRCRMVENEMNVLKEPMEEAVEYLKLENDIMRAKNILIQKEIQTIQSDSAKKMAEREQIQTEVNTVMEKLTALEDEYGKKKKIYSNASKAYTALEVTRDQCKQAFNKLNNKDVELRAEMEETNKNRKKVKKQLEEEKKKKIEYSELPEKAEKSIKELQDKEQQLVKKKDGLEEDKQKVLASLKDCTKELQERREVLQTELVEIRSKVDEAKSSFTIAESELKRYRSDEEAEQKKLDNMKTTYENVKKLIVERKRDIDSLKKEIPVTEKSLHKAQQESERLTTQQHEVQADRRKKMSSLETARSSMQASRSKGRVLDSLTQQKREGKCPGFFGRLGDLGAIDKKYDVAVSTACGALDHIVVDTVDTAEWCIEFLKKHDVGRASFIALNKQDHLRDLANSRIQTPENVARLYDLIKIQDERVKTAFYFALRDTLVANNLDQASRIAYGTRRYRVVTLAGDLIETSGTMSGGGKSVSRGRMGQTVAVAEIQPQEVQKMETDLQRMEEEYRKNQERLTTLEQEINALRPKLKEMKLNLNKHTIELESLKIQEPALMQQMSEQTRKAGTVKLDQNVLKKLTNEAEQTKELYEKEQSSASKFQVEVDAITKEINEKTSGRVQAVDKKINETNKNLNAVRSEITKTKVSITTAERNLKKCEEKISTMESDITNAEQRLLEMKAQREEIETDGATMMKHLEGLAEQLEQQEQELKDMKKELTTLEKQEMEIKGEKIEVNEKLRTADKQMREIDSMIAGCKAELAKLKLHDIPEQTVEELKTYTVDELAEKEEKALKHEIASCKQAIQQKQPNFSAIKDYRIKKREYIDRAAEADAVNKQRNQIGAAFDSLKSRRKTEFLNAFRIIKLKLKEMYQMITLGGDADLEIIDSYDPFTEGVKFNVRPPKKPWKSISNLSGGEKTLSSLALVFALHYYKPSPLYVMDEIDAALDFKNVSIVARYIKDRTKNAQFIVISLRPNMFELANYMIGICKVRDCTRAITVDTLSLHTLLKNANAALPGLLFGDDAGAMEDRNEINISLSPTGEEDSEDLNTVVADSFDGSSSRDLSMETGVEPMEVSN